ncbi:ABC transporter ATP-binding protein [Pseudoclavibacter sp. CFCC 11306]|uniref:ABC transporter ATP-binding protein n=1 Tax=Pseudoclavibacter sp. CFCC 11306 TaxID=1564493 RepID=UPI00130177DE|nr:ABC transporter ATP-binding protein [Pseudoclavibacter sp. CFCC 11306]KAB1657612.1 ABC transporter ATP-binding protein [Pseudoclavibacter sp. CFCC 11306]
MPSLVLERASCVYPGAAEPAVRDVSLSVDDGAFLTLLGQSGSGKSTLLRMIAGLEETASGAVRIDGREVTRLPPKHRNVAMVFQNYALYPQMSVRDNIAFALKVAGVDQTERDRRVSVVADGLDLDDLLSSAPHELSGRERQRVAVGRALARIPDLLLLDEPFTSLPADVRHPLLSSIRTLAARLGVTTLYATRDLSEAALLDEPIAVLDGGRLHQIGSLAHLRSRPEDLTVAQTVIDEPLTCWTASAEDGTICIGDQCRIVPGAHGPVVLAIASRHMTLSDQREDLGGTVEHIAPGPDGGRTLTLRLADRDRSECQMRTDGVRLQPGDRVRLAVAVELAWVFHADSGRLLAAPAARG